MKEYFSKECHNKFINHFKMKPKAWEIELAFYDKTKRYLKYIKFLPWLNMIWIWNSISMNCATKNSDIDLFIVSSKNTMWINRLFISITFQILWVRKTKKKHAWKFCLSFFSTIDGMNFESWKLNNDIYLYFWIIYLKPILNYNNSYESFIEKNSKWADLSEYKDIIEDNKSYISYIKNWYNNNNNNIYNNNIYNIKQNILSFINNIIKYIFLNRSYKKFDKLWKPYWIIINNDILKFHNNDIRKQTKKVFNL